MDPALDELRAAHAGAPEDARSYAALRSALHGAGHFVELAELTERWGARQLSPVEGARAFAEAAEWLEHAGRLERAHALYVRALELDARQAIASNAICRLAAVLRDPHARLPVLERWLERLRAIGATSEERADAHLALGRMQAAMPGRIDKALVHFREAFALDAELAPALDEAIALVRKARRTRDVRSLLELAALHTRDPLHRVALLRELARERLTPPVEVEQALEALELALHDAPDDVEARHELVALLMARASRGRGTESGAADQRRAADELVALATRLPSDVSLPFIELSLELDPEHEAARTLHAAHPLVIADPKRYVLRALAYLARAGDGEATLTVRRKLARMYAERKQVEPARKMLDVPAARGDLDCAELSLALALDDGRLVDAVHHARVAFADLPEAERRRAFGGLLARASLHDDLDAMRLCGESMLILDANDELALRALRRVHEVRGAHAAERSVLERLCAVVTDASEKKRFLRTIATLSEGALGEPARAIDALYVTARADPSDTETRVALTERLRRAGRFNEVGDILAWEATHLGTQTERRASLASLLELDSQHPLDPAMMVATLRAYRNSDPGDADVRNALVAKLVPAGASAEIAALHAEAVAAATNDAERVVALRALGDVREHGLEDADGAWAAFSRLLDLEPTDLDAVERLARLAARTKDGARAIEALERRARAVPSDERIPVLVELARAIEQSGPDGVASATAAYEEAYALDPGAAGVADALRRLYAKSERFLDLARLLDELALACPDDAARMALLRERAHLFRDVLDDVAAAARVFARMRLIEEDDEALLAVIDAARASAHHRELSTLLEIRIERAESMLERRELAMERATVLLDHLGDIEAGKAELVRVRSIDPTFVPALARLASVFQDEGAMEALAETLEAQLGVVGQPGVKAGLAKRLFELYTTRVPDDAKALGALRAWVRATPFDVEALREISVRVGEDPEEHVKVLETLAIELVRRVEKGRKEGSLVAEREADEVVSTLLLAASVASRVLEDVERAQKHLRRALAIAYVSESLTFALEQAAIELDLSTGASFRAFVVHELVVLARAAERPTKDALFLRAANLAGGALEDGPLAFAILSDAMPEVPGNEAVLAALVDFGTTSSLEDELDAVLAARIEASLDAKDAKALLRERTQLLYALERFDLAADQCSRLVSMSPDDERLRARHRECLGRAGRHQDLLLALDQAVRRVTPGSSEHVALMREIAETWEGALENRFEAADAWRNVLKHMPGDREAELALERLVPRTRVGVDDVAQAARPSARPPRTPTYVPPRPPSALPPPPGVDVETREPDDVP